jgi:hypothetical protein
MLAQFLGLPHGFDLLEGNVDVMDNPPTHELEMLGAHIGPFIQGSSCNPPPSWGMLLELHALAIHYIHQAWHILPSPSPQVLVDPSHGPLGLQPLDFRVV